MIRHANARPSITATNGSRNFVGNLVSGFNDAKWMDEALCAQTDPEVFFPERGGPNREAKKVCAMCHVGTDCLNWAIEHNESEGIWGGMSAKERAREIQRRRTVTT